MMNYTPQYSLLIVIKKSAKEQLSILLKQSCYGGVGNTEIKLF